MLEWLEVRLDVGCDNRLVYEPLKCDRDALKQECRLATHLSEKIQRARSYCAQSYLKSNNLSDTITMATVAGHLTKKHR